jgi:hydroxypyruvate isomerase
MNRRTFAQSMAASALAAVAAGRAAVAEAVPLSKGPEFGLSVMLWTVFRDLPFEQRLEKVAEAGYRNVELVGEYAKWTDADFERANAARKRLGIAFDSTAGRMGHAHGCRPVGARSRFWS